MEAGLGFFVELTLPEAVTFADKKIKALEDKQAKLADQACQVII